MTKYGVRSLMLFGMVFVFMCLLLGGGWRLVGSGAGEEEPIPVRDFSSVRAAISSAPALRAETSISVRREESAQRMHAVPAPDHQALKQSVPSDANGNVLLGRTYMRAVYQAFTLDDGFV